MSIKGKVIGGAIGTVLEPLGTVIGAWIGHQFDKDTEVAVARQHGESG